MAALGDDEHAAVDEVVEMLRGNLDKIPQSANAHIIGCRVMAKTPRASAGTGVGDPGLGSAGLRTIEPISRTDASSITTVAATHRPSPTATAAYPQARHDKPARAI